MRAACFALSFRQKRGVLEGGWLQAGSSHFNEKSHFVGRYFSHPKHWFFSPRIVWYIEVPFHTFLTDLVFQSKH